MQGVGYEEGGEDIEAEVIEETRGPKRIHDFVSPSRTEMDLHTWGHVPFRSWCEHCVSGRGEGIRHEKIQDMPEQVEVHMDFCCVGDEGHQKKLTILTARERQTRMTMSAVAPTKGVNEFLARPPGDRNGQGGHHSEVR